MTGLDWLDQDKAEMADQTRALRALSAGTMAEVGALANRLDHADWIRMSETIPRREFCEMAGISYETLARYRSGKLPLPRWVIVITILLQWVR